MEDATPGLTDPLAVVQLAATLEEVAMDTYLANLSLLEDTETREIMGSVMGVESQHLAVLRAVRALLEGDAADLIAIPTDVAALPAAGGSNDGGGDLAIAAGAAGLEVLAVNTHTAAADAAAAGDLGEVPPAVGEYVGTALEQHQTALDAWNTVLVDAGEPEVTEPPAELETTVNEAFAEVTDVTGVAELALMLEAIAAQTYLAASPMLESPDAITLAGQLQINDMQHSAILNFVLGEYPVPDVFQPTTESALG